MEFVAGLLFFINVGFIIYFFKIKQPKNTSHYAPLNDDQDLAKFFKVSLDFMCVANEAGEFERVNQALIQRLGYKEDELLGEKVIEFIHPNDIRDTHKKLRRLYQGLQVEGIVNRFRCHDGNYVALKWNCVPDMVHRKLYAAARDLTDQEKTAKDLKRLSRIARETHNGVLITGPTEKIEWVNSGFTRMTGFTLEDVIGKKPGHVFQGAQTSLKTRELMAKAIKNQEPFKTEILNYKKTGEAYWLDVDCTPFFDDNGQLEGFMAIETDITEQKNSQLQLKKSAELLEQMSEHGRIGAWEVDLVAEKVYWSDMTRQIHEVSKDFEPNIEEAINFYKEGESRDSIQQIFHEALITGKPWRHECQLVTNKGNEVWVASTGQAEFKDGKCVRVFGSFQDINERKIHQLLNRRALKFSHTLEELTVNRDVVAGNLDKALPVCLEACADALGVSRVSVWFFKDDEKLIECACLYDAKTGAYDKGMVFTQEEHPAYIHAIKNKKMISAYDVHTHPDLKELLPHYINELNITSLLNVAVSGDGSFFGVVCLENTHKIYKWNESDESFISAVATIISSVCDRKIRKETEVELLAAVKKANDAVKVKSEFLASMSHEIRTPMNGVIGMLRSVLKTPLADNQKHKVYVAKKSAESLLNIINDILDFSKIDAGKMEFEHIPFDLLDFIDHFYEEMHFLAAEKNIEFIINTQGVKCQNLVGDPIRIKQVLINLTSNALKFTHEGYITITLKTHEVSPRQHKIIGTVEDTGIGIPESKIALLFDAFTQVDASTTREYGGTGLGLSIVSKLCKSMGGDVSVTSTPKKGSCFTFELCVEQGESAVLNDAPSQNISSINEGAKVLLVEDNRINQEVAEDLLCDLNLDVCVASNGEVALEALNSANQDAPFDVVLMDCQMPTMDGYTATQKIRDGHAGVNNTSIPIIAMTANAMVGDKQRCLKAGMDDYISKPVDPQHLRAVLSKWLPAVSGQQNDDLTKMVPNISDANNKIEPITHNKTHSGWNKDALLKRVNHKPERVNRLLGLYIDDSEKLAKDIHQHIEQGNIKEAAFSCHSLKGISSNVGAVDVAQCAAELDKSCRDKEPLTPLKHQELNALYQDLSTMHRELLTELRSHLTGS